MCNPAGRAALEASCEAAVAAAEAQVALAVLVAACVVPAEAGMSEASREYAAEERRGGGGRRERLDALRSLSGWYGPAAGNGVGRNGGRANGGFGLSMATPPPIPAMEMASASEEAAEVEAAVAAEMGADSLEAALQSLPQSLLGPVRALLRRASLGELARRV